MVRNVAPQIPDTGPSMRQGTGVGNVRAAWAGL